ncbi:MAG: phospho-N-acetylmuramoyl-pentapeptide-transferase [Salibacteraceae bacterium]|nr:phospho-N-acetylmuramoyl-pentapeptide-transferase [Salibacteraceae bacterium]MDP4686812.1 phospho-N-acetylmuramoyl-pentapeptide-transferase [Salibacteraceae bacterium]MDP4763114.1 phospho-N-acetylmuramoyl-pentapeptide-transferase [Salibacteraceae bacterium]MDP4934612.1 phospho-N-acetylmuramoyl-pentapeptide-transferase [Salibacteraceae bacterium]MDP4965703.1 phospho-N-acetylmuramoyl-pentapeptide-transferase [Salibacteraceae bacterium]
MFYYLFTYLNEMDVPGAGLFQYVTFRTAMAVFTSLLISMVFGKRIISYLRKLQVGETVRDLGLEGQMQKQGTPTMGGLIILAAIIIPTLLFAKLHNTYIWLMLISTVWLGAIGFADDYIKVFKKDKKGLAGKFKIVGQVGIGIIAGAILYFNGEVTIKHKAFDAAGQEVTQQVVAEDGCISTEPQWIETNVTKTTIPFVKNNEFDYRWLLDWAGDTAGQYAWIVYILVVIVVVTAVSNGANMTDGLDGLAGGTSAIIGLTLAIFAYVSSNLIFADYLNIMYVPMSEELVIYMGAFIGACIGFLWYNSYPAQVFMGDTGSLAIGGIIAIFALAIKKELLIPIFCGVFLVENMSVMLQVGYFKYTKKKFGEGRRIFLMAPLHHHFQKKGLHESKIVSRFWIIGVMLAVLSIITLKLR